MFGRKKEEVHTIPKTLYRITIAVCEGKCTQHVIDVKPKTHFELDAEELTTDTYRAVHSSWTDPPAYYEKRREKITFDTNDVIFYETFEANVKE